MLRVQELLARCRRSQLCVRRISNALIAAGLTLALASAPLSADAAPANATLAGKHSLRAPVTDETFYFVMADRFERARLLTTPAVSRAVLRSTASIRRRGASTPLW